MNLIAKQPGQGLDELLDWLRLRTLRDKSDLYTLGAALDDELGIAQFASMGGFMIREYAR
jgi:hypothetical protein